MNEKSNEKKETDARDTDAKAKANPENVTARDIMDTKYPTIDISKQIGDAHRVMSERHLDCLPVVRDQKVIRMVTFNNLEVIRSPHFDAVGQSDRMARMMCLPLSSVNQNQKLISVRAEDPIKNVIPVLVENKISSLPVLKEGGEMLGMITTHMILKYYTNS